MSVKQIVWKLLVVLTLAGLLVGCSSPTAAPTPTVAPVVATTAATVDPLPTFNFIKTQAAATIIANLTQNAPSATPVAPTTATQPPLPTATPVPSITPTLRATVKTVTTPTTPVILTAWTLAPTQAAYSCIVTGYSPKKTDTFSPSTNFDVYWTVKNTGKQKWLATETQFHYADGVKMQKKGDTVDLKTDVAPNGSYTVGIDMVAPPTAGTYWISWQLRYGNVSICTLSLAVVVK